MSKKTQAKLAVLLGNAIFGLSFLFSKLALQLTIPSVLIAARFTAAFAVLNAIVLVGKNVKKADGTPLIAFSLRGKPLRDVLLMALFQPVIYFMAENYGILYTSSAFAGVIIAVIPIAGLAFDFLLLRSKISRKQVICACFSVLGVVLTTVGAKDMTSSAKGIVVLLIAVIAAALFYVFSKQAAADYNPLERTYVMFGVGSVTYLVIALIQCRGSYDSLILAAFARPMFWAAIAYLAVLSSVIAFLLLNFGSSHISVSQASLFANFTTVISTLAGVLLLHESFTLPQVIGTAVILVSVYIAQ